MGIFDRNKNVATRDDIALMHKSIDLLTTAVGKLTDTSTRLALLIQEQHAAVAELYMIQSQILVELAEVTSKGSIPDVDESTSKKSTKMN